MLFVADFVYNSAASRSPLRKEGIVSLASIIGAALKTERNAPAIYFGERSYSWDWMRAVADQVKHSLLRAGVAADAPVGIVARNRPAFAAALLGSMRDARSSAMIYSMQSPESIAGDIVKLNLAAILADREDWTSKTLAAAAQCGTAAITLDSDVEEPVSQARGRERAGPGPHREPFAAPGIEMLTSGTTGTPKRYLMSFELMARSMLGESIIEISRPDTSAHISPAYIYLPFGNISGLYGYLPNAAIARPCILTEKFSLDTWRHILRKHRPRHAGLPPAGVQMVLAQNVPSEELASLEYISAGAAPLDRQLHREFEERYGIPILMSYGATEFGGPVTLMTPALRKEFGASKFDSVGRSWAGAQLRVVDPDTHEPLPPGSVGVLEVIAPRIGPEWTRTTDLAVLDEDGFMFHRGRADGAIVRGGFKILPEVVVEALRKHPAVAAAAVVGQPDSRLGQTPVAAIELKPGASRPSEAELEAHARRHLYRTHVPTKFLIVDALPRTPSLKVSTPGVLALFAQQSTSL
jgi:long-chain acyl-CoA synthetase